MIDMYTIWGLDLNGVYKETLIKGLNLREVKKYRLKHFMVDVGGCVRGDFLGMVPEPGMGSGFIDATCPNCSRKMSWFGTLEASPPCRHCGQPMDMVQLTALRIKYLTEKCLYYEHMPRRPSAPPATRSS